MWIWLAVGSAFMLATLFSTLFLSPWLSAGPLQDHLRLILKAVLVTVSWIAGMEGLKRLPITIASTIKASRPVFVLLLSILIFGEKLNGWQWAGSIVALVALYMLSLSSRKEGIVFRRNAGVAWMALSVVAGVVSALWDKHILGSMEPLFVQGWTNIYITAILGAILAFRAIRAKRNPAVTAPPFHPDWVILLIAVFITGADMLYFFSLHAEGALLSVISLLRRSSVIVTFAVGAVMFKEKNIARKSAILALMLAGVVLLMASSLH